MNNEPNPTDKAPAPESDNSIESVFAAPKPPALDFTACIIYRAEDAPYLPDCIASIRRFDIPVILVKTVPVQQGDCPRRTVFTGEADGCMYYDYYYEVTAGASRHNYAANKFSFAEARNACLLHAKTEWIISIDADERLCAERSELEAIQSAPEDVSAVYIKLHNHIANARKPHENFEAGVHNIVRIFRREKHRWTGRVHEQILAPGYPLNQIGESSIIIKHIGYDASDAALLNKYIRNIGLLSSDILNARFAEMNSHELYMIKSMKDSIAYLFTMRGFTPSELKLFNLNSFKENISYIKEFSVNLSFSLEPIIDFLKSSCMILIKNPANKGVLEQTFLATNLFWQLFVELKNGD
jgi:glycosyltransferase involved in cell wall biosynthesis